MNKLSVHQRKNTKLPKPKKNPIKVVYISNPMKVKTTVSQFRALVQELTGQDSDILDAAKFSEIDDIGADHDQGIIKVSTDDHDHVLKIPGMDPYGSELPPGTSESLLEPFDHDALPSQSLLESLVGFLPSHLFCESPDQLM